LQRNIRELAKLDAKAGVFWNFPSLRGSDGTVGGPDFDDAFYSALSDIKNDSNPGWPMGYKTGDNKDAIDMFGNTIRNNVLKKITNILDGNFNLDEFMAHPEFWLKFGLRDPNRVFCKNESTPARKKNGRIIQADSLEDQIVHRIFFSDLLLKESDSYPAGFNLKGMGFSGRRMEEIFEQHQAWFDHLKAPFVSKSDVKGWEKAFSTELAEAISQVMRLTNANVSADSLRAIEWWWKSLISNLAVDDDGNIIRMKINQLQRSGNLLTNYSNGRGRALLALLAGSKYMKTNGDDCVEYHLITAEKLKVNYLKMNLVVRDMGPLTRGEFEHSSHVFTTDESGRVVCYLSGWERMAFDAVMKRKATLLEIRVWLQEIMHHPDHRVLKAWRELVTLKAAIGEVEVNPSLLPCALGGHD
jgi:hypothetical protein